MHAAEDRSGTARLLWVLALALIALLASACGGSNTDTAPAETASGDAEATAVPAPSPLMGQFDSVVSGESIDLAEFEGENVVMWFWEPW